MTNQQYINELYYFISLILATEMYDNSLISKKEFKRLEEALNVLYKPILRQLYTDI